MKKLSSILKFYPTHSTIESLNSGEGIMNDLEELAKEIVFRLRNLNAEGSSENKKMDEIEKLIEQEVKRNETD